MTLEVGDVVEIVGPFPPRTIGFSMLGEVGTIIGGPMIGHDYAQNRSSGQLEWLLDIGFDALQKSNSGVLFRVANVTVPGHKLRKLKDGNQPGSWEELKDIWSPSAVHQREGRPEALRSG